MPRSTASVRILAVSIVMAAITVSPPTAAQVDLGGGAQIGGNFSADSLVRVRLAADTEAIQPGSTFHVAAIFDIAHHWHIYWVNSGDSGAPTEVSITAPEGFTVGRPLYPRPEAFDEMGARTYGYADRVAILVPVKAPAELPPGPHTFEADVFFLVCRDVCLAGRVKRTVALETAEPAAQSPAPGLGSRSDPDAALIRTYRKRLPMPLEKLEGAQAGVEDDRLVITGPAGDFRDVRFIPFHTPGVTYGDMKARIADGRFQITVALQIRPQNALGGKLAAGGLLTLGKKIDQPSYHLELPAGTGRKEG